MPLILLNKPYRVLCQFTDESGRDTLARFVRERSVYPAGRLDFDSEGLVLLTDDGALQSRIADPRSKLPKRYWVQVEGIADRESMDTLLSGVDLKDGAAAALSVERIDEPAALWRRNPPIRERKRIPTSWLDLVIDEGRNRQVRRMTAAVGLPTLRLIRYRVGPFELHKLQPGEAQTINNRAAWQRLDADNQGIPRD